MSAALARYLLQYGELALPKVGTLRVITQPAQVDITSKLIEAPRYTISFIDAVDVSNHQAWAFEKVGPGNEADAAAFAKKISESLSTQDVFEWKNIGTFHKNVSGAIVFHAAHEAFVLPAVAAQKIVRNGAQHQVLVGDQLLMVNGNGTTEQEAIGQQKPIAEIITWILIGVAAAFILFHLYQHQFEPTAAAQQTSVETAKPASTYDE